MLSSWQSRFSTRNWFLSGIEMLGLGGVCAALAYEIGDLVTHLIH